MSKSVRVIGLMSLLFGLSIALAADVEPQKAKPPKFFKFRIGASNSGNSDMYISVDTTFGYDTAQYILKPKSSKTFTFKTPVVVGVDGTILADVIVSVNSGSIIRMDQKTFTHQAGVIPVNPFDTDWDFGESQLDVAEWENGFVWSVNPKHK
ncbi:MAG: hypothetical protein KDA68_12790 [Planctomycetaceae bacterium]|nr:hypothetical protein [Planctomycetaceae bacterium]